MYVSSPQPKPCKTCGSCPTCGKVAAPVPTVYPRWWYQQSQTVQPLKVWC